jgi:hypothetical protein
VHFVPLRAAAAVRKPSFDVTGACNGEVLSGIGIAGPTLAYWLALYGFKTTLVEIAPHLRKAATSNAGYEYPCRWMIE